MTNPPPPSTAFARAVRAAQQQLQAAGVSPNVFRSRARVIPKQQTTAVVVRLHQAEGSPSAGQGATMLWQTALQIDCYARASAGVDADEAVDALLYAAQTTLMADPTLGGVVGALAPVAVAWDFDVDGEQTACATVTFYMQHLAVHLA